MTLTFGLSPLLLAACMLAAAGLTYWTYRGTVPQLSTVKRAVLITLRFAALTIILVLLFQPVLRRVDRDTRPPVLAVLVDDSESLRITTGAPDSAAAAPVEAVRDVANRISGDAGGGEVRIFRFAGDVSSASALPDPEDSLAFGGDRTDIAQALLHVRDALRDENLGGVLLLSDGRYNTGRSPLYVAERYPVPIYSVTMGDTTRQRDVQVRRVSTNEIAYLDTELPIQVGLRSEGYGGESVTVTLLHDGQVRADARVQLPEGTAEVPVDLTFTPEQVGLHQLRVSITQLEGETTYRNNEESFSVRVLQSRRRILLVAAAPDPDVGALRQVLESDPSTEVNAYVQKSRGTFYEGPLPSSLDDYDVIVLAGYPGTAADDARVQRIASAVEDGTPLLFLMNRATDVGRAARALQDVLPVTPESLRRSFAEASVVPTPEGLRHPLLQLPDAGAGSWERLPPLLVNQSRWQPTPDATVLARLRVRDVDLEDPLLVVRRRSGQRVAALLGAGTWRWNNVPEDLDDLAHLWPGLVENIVQWLSAHEDDRPVRVEPVQTFFGGDEAVQMTGQVYDESLNPVPDASVEVRVTAPDGSSYPYVMEPIGNGRYTLEVGSLPEGSYEYTAEAGRDETVLGSDGGQFAVGALSLEYKETRADAALMRQIAQRSGGTSLSPGALDLLPSTLAASSTFSPLVVEEERATQLWQLYGFLAAVIFLLAMEWFLRKRSGLV